MPAVGNESSHIFDGVTVRGGLALEGGGGSTYLSRFAAARTARDAALYAALNLLVETFPYNTAANQTAVTGTQAVMFAPVGFLAGDVITNIVTKVHVAGNTLTLQKFGIYSKAGVLLASTADVKANFLTTGIISSALTAPYTILADDGYYLAVLSVGTTTPTLLRTVGQTTVAGSIAGGSVGYGGTQASQSDLPAAATISFTTASTFWLAAN